MSRKALLLQSAVCATALGGAFFAGRATVTSSSPEAMADNGKTRLNPVPSESFGGKSGQHQDANAPAAGKESPAAARMIPATPEQAAARLKEIFENQDPVARMADYLVYLKTLTTNEARSSALASMLENFNPRERGKELNMLMSEWASSDPVAALASVKDNKDWTGTMAASTVLSKWVSTNPDAAIAWATENGKEGNETENGNFYMVGLLGTLAKTDLDRAASLTESMGRSRARGEAMDRVLDQYLAQRTPEATQAWAAGLSESPYKDGLMSRLAGRLASKDGAAAAAWASTLPETQNKPQVLAQVIERWSREQPNEAGAWLNQFPMSPATDDPRETFAWQVQKKDPEAAIAWANTITDERRRDRATRDLIKTWAEREPDMVRQWVDANNVSEKVKQRYGTKPNG